jgi:very-short-patch-repair endonuclease
MKPSPQIFLALLRSAGIPPPVTEHRFHPVRLWRMDYAWPARKVALEVEGGVWSGGRHTRGAGFLKDCEKYNAAALAGWLVLRVTPSTLCTAQTVEMVKAAGAREVAAK